MYVGKQKKIKRSYWQKIGAKFRKQLSALLFVHNNRQVVLHYRNRKKEFKKTNYKDYLKQKTSNFPSCVVCSNKKEIL